jgi:hypothetical protein
VLLQRRTLLGHPGKPYSTSKSWTLPSGDGTKTVYVKFKDSAGNVSSVYSDSIILDTTPPAAPSNLTASPSGWTNINSFSVSWTNPSDLSGIAGAWYKLDNPPTSNTDGTYVAGLGRTSLSGITVSGDGSHTIYVWLQDVAGNVNYSNYSTTTLYLDTVPPSAPINLSILPENTSLDDFTASWVNPPDLSGIAGAYYKDNSPPTHAGDGTYVEGENLSQMHLRVYTVGEHWIYIWLRDRAGNENYLAWSCDNVYLLPPPGAPTVWSDTHPDQSRWYSDNNPTLRWTCESEIPLKGYSFCLDNNPTTEPDNILDVNNTVDNISYTNLSDGVWYFHIKAQNIENAWGGVAHYTLRIDTKPPTGSIVINGDATYTTSTSVTLTLTYNDATSGVYQVRYSNDGVWDTEPWESPSPTRSWTLPSGDGTKTVYYQIKDYAGNLSTTYSDSIILDTTPPTGSIAINDNAPYTNSTSVTLTLSASDANGVSQMCFSNDNVTWTSWETYSTSKSWTLPSGDGTKTVYVKFKGFGRERFLRLLRLHRPRHHPTHRFDCHQRGQHLHYFDFRHSHPFLH